MRILITTPTFPPQSGGVATVAERQRLALLERGHQVGVLTTGDAQPCDAGAGITRLPIVARRFPSYAAGDWLGIRDQESRSAYLRAVSRFKPDVVLSHCWQAWNTDWLMDQIDTLRIPVLLFSHGTSVNTVSGKLGWLRWLRWRTYAWQRIPRTLRRVNGLIALADHADRDRFLDVRIARRLGMPVITIPNGSTEAIFDEGGDAAHSRETLVLCVGQYTEEKNFAAVLEAFAAAGNAAWRLSFCGSQANDYLTRLQSRAAALGLTPRVEFFVAQSRPQLAALYRRASVFAFASVTECQPLVLLDAMASGIPFISTDVGCVRTFPGGLVAGRDGADFVAGLARLMDEPSLRAHLGTAGRAAVARVYNWHRASESLESALLAAVRDFRPTLTAADSRA